MSDDAQNPYLLYPERPVQKRVRYYDGQFLGSADFLLAQAHPIDRQRRHLANSTSPGVLDGLAVHGETDAVVIAPGTAVDAAGRLLVLTQNARRAIQAADRSKNLTLWVRYREEASDDSSVDKGAAGLTRFDETPEIMYTADGVALPDGVMIIARLQVDGAGNVNVDTTVRPRAGLRIPGPIPLTLTGDDSDPGRGTLSGALKLEVPAGAAHSTTRPALDVLGHGRVRNGMIVGQESNVGYRGVTNDGNDLVVNGQLAAGGGAGSAIYKLGIGYGPPGQGEGTLTAQRIGIGTESTGEYTLRVLGNSAFSGYTLFSGNTHVTGELRTQNGIDFAPGVDEGDSAAGQIRYKRWTDGLDIVGAGNATAERKITFHAQGGSRHLGDLRVEDDLTATRDVTANRNLSAAVDLSVGRNVGVAGRITTQTLTINGDARSNALFDGHNVNVRNALTTQHLTATGGSNLQSLGVQATANLNGRVNVNGDRLVVGPVAELNGRVIVGGDQLRVDNRLVPSVGSDNTKGIVWPVNPGGGGGDVAAIRYYAYSGENTTLQIENGNDPDDVITLRQGGENRVVVRNGRVGVNLWEPATDLHVGGGARVDGDLDVSGLLFARGRFAPSVGRDNNGIVWTYNAFGGGGDFAKIQYASWGGENAALELSIGNDPNDIIVLKQKGGDRLTVKDGKVGVNANDPSHSLTVGGASYLNGDLRLDGLMDLGAKDGDREGNAGKIGYKHFSSDALDIVGGGGPNAGNRKVRIWSEAGLVLSGWAQFSGGLALHNNGNNHAVCAWASGTRIIWGAVKSDGSKWTGEGFTCERYNDHRGVFIIRFNPKFSSRPAVVASQHYPTDNDGSNSWGNTKDNAVVARTSKDWVIIATGEGDGDRQYRSFEFIAIGRV